MYVQYVVTVASAGVGRAIMTHRMFNGHPWPLASRALNVVAVYDAWCQCSREHGDLDIWLVPS